MSKITIINIFLINFKHKNLICYIMYKYTKLTLLISNRIEHDLNKLNIFRLRNRSANLCKNQFHIDKNQNDSNIC